METPFTSDWLTRHAAESADFEVELEPRSVAAGRPRPALRWEPEEMKSILEMILATQRRLGYMLLLVSATVGGWFLVDIGTSGRTVGRTGLLALVLVAVPLIHALMDFQLLRALRSTKRKPAPSSGERTQARAA